jgi:guanosine-3',5'-bis(diphosphate) 3'-pyrophosphohydrolase
MPGAIEAVKLLSEYFDLYILSTAPWKNISAWSEKAAWVQKYFGDGKDSVFYKRLIISHHKNLNLGDFLIDDRTKNGAGDFEGELIQFGSERFPNWDMVIRYLICEKDEKDMEKYLKRFSLNKDKKSPFADYGTIAQVAWAKAGYENGYGLSAKKYVDFLQEWTKENFIDTRDIQTIYQETIKFAAERHGDQKIPSSKIPYVVHLSNVCMEILLAAAHTEDFNLSLAVQVALLHDVLEDTDTTEKDLDIYFGDLITFCVLALTKLDDIPREEKIQYSLQMIKQCPKEIWAVKLADRITNLQPPPAHWTQEKIRQYYEEAKLIYEELKDGNAYLAERLKLAIENYGKY